MTGTTQTESEVVQNLLDAGCADGTIQSFLNCYRAGEHDWGLRLLAVQRRALLDLIHDGQKKLDCLDYLVYQLKRN